MSLSNHTWPGFSLATIIITYRCPISCPMCFLQCGPHRTEVIDRPLAFDVLSQVADLDIPFLGLTGGEPLFERGLLRELSSKADELGLSIILVTNAYWASSAEAALRVLSDLKQRGVIRLQVSLDEQHQQWIPIERVAFAVQAATALGFEDVKLIGTSKGNSEKFKYQLFYLQELLRVNLIGIDLIDRPRVAVPNFPNEEQRRYSFEDLCHAKDFRPDDCLTQMMIDVDGQVYPCCNNFVGAIGNAACQPLNEIIHRSQQNQFWEIMWDSGPTGLAVYLDMNYGTTFCQQRYESWCALCEKIFSDARFTALLESPDDVVKS